MNKLKTMKQVKDAVDSGKRVHWNHSGYTVIKDSIDQYLVVWALDQGWQKERAVGLGGLAKRACSRTW
jgi:hypothetical protein